MHGKKLIKLLGGLSQLKIIQVVWKGGNRKQVPLDASQVYC
jgi:hypothetical protein